MDAVTTSHIGVVSALQGYRNNSSASGTRTPISNEPESGVGKNSADTVTISSDGKELSEKNNTNSPQSNSSNQNDVKTKLDTQDLKILSDLKRRDREVRSHEQAHLSTAGRYAAGGASFATKKGPDGSSYAVSGEVPINMQEESTPEATIAKMQVIRRAALAPASPSSADRRIAAKATAKAVQAQQEILQESQKELLKQETEPTDSPNFIQEPPPNSPPTGNTIEKMLVAYRRVAAFQE